MATKKPKTRASTRVWRGRQGQALAATEAFEAVERSASEETQGVPPNPKPNNRRDMRALLRRHVKTTIADEQQRERMLAAAEWVMGELERARKGWVTKAEDSGDRSMSQLIRSCTTILVGEIPGAVSGLLELGQIGVVNKRFYVRRGWLRPDR